MVDNRITSVREDLLAAVTKVKPSTAARVRQLDRMESQRRLWRDEAEGSFRELEARRMKAEAERDRDQTLNTIRALVRQLGSIEGSKTIVFLSDGFAFNASPEAFAADKDSYSSSIFDDAVRADVRFYPVDVRGLNRDRGAGDVDRIPIDISDATALKDPRVGIFEEDAGASIAQATGGFNVRAQNNLGLPLDRIARDAGNYNVLGYHPTHAVPEAASAGSRYRSDTKACTCGRAAATLRARSSCETSSGAADPLARIRHQRSAGVKPDETRGGSPASAPTTCRRQRRPSRPRDGAGAPSV